MRIQAQKGRPSEAWKRRPILTEHQQFLWGAFLELHARRPVGMEVCAISYSEMEAYGRVHLIDDPTDLQDFIYVISTVDLAWMKDVRNRSRST